MLKLSVSDHLSCVNKMTSFSITWFSLASFLASWHVVENRRELLQLEVCVLDGALEVPDVDEAVQGALVHNSRD